MVTWLAYAGFYFCRKNFSVVMPFLQEDLHFTKDDLANVLFGFNLLYMIGQFTNGPLADRWGPRLIVSLGILLAALSNVAMAFATVIPALFLLSCLNGMGQATGWPGLIKNMSAWFRVRERGVVMAWWGTCYVIGGYVATRFAIWVASSFGWRAGFWLPALVLAAIGILFAVITHNTPGDAGIPDIVDEEDTAPETEDPTPNTDDRAPTIDALSQPAVWIVGVSYFFVKLTRYSLLFWLPTYMVERLHYSKAVAGNTSAYYELVGFLGAVASGYISDKLFRSRRFPVGALMLFGLALAFLLQIRLVSSGVTANALGISLLGFLTFGPDTLVTGAGAMDLGTRRGAATVAGVINGIGSCGQLLSAHMVARVASSWGWDSLFYLFAIFSFIGGALLCTRWNFGGRVPSSSPD